MERSLWKYKIMNYNHSSNENDMFQIANVEEEFLHAAEFGDIQTVKRILNDYKNFNTDCTDALGRTALRLAVKNEHQEVRLSASQPIIFILESTCFSK